MQQPCVRWFCIKILEADPFISCCPPCELCDLRASCFPSLTLIPLSVRESLCDLDAIKYGLSLVQGGPQPVVFVIPNTVQLVHLLNQSSQKSNQLLSTE